MEPGDRVQRPDEGHRKHTATKLQHRPSHDVSKDWFALTTGLKLTPFWSANIFILHHKWTAFIPRFYNHWPIKALYNIARHSPIHAYIHTPTAESATQGDSHLVWSSLSEASCSGTPRHSNYQPSGYETTHFITLKVTLGPFCAQQDPCGSSDTSTL